MTTPAPPERLHLRPATTHDRDLLREWRNDASTIAASFASGQATAEEHEAWLVQTLADPRCRLWIAEHDGHPVGQARAERTQDGVAVISITVAPRARGQGLAAVMMGLTAQLARRELGASEVVAHVKPDNSRSLRALARAGFSVTGRTAAEIELRHRG